MKEYLDLEFIENHLKESNQLEKLKKMEDFKIEIEKKGLRISDFEYQYDAEGSDNGIVPKHKFLPKYDEMPFNGDKKIKNLQTKISSNMEMKTQLGQIKNALSSIQNNNLIEDVKEIILSGCFNMYFSFFQGANGFSRLEFKDMKKYGASHEMYDIGFIEGVFSLSRDVRNRHFAHKDMAISSHILSFYGDPGKNGLAIQVEEKHIVYLHTDDKFIKNFLLLIDFTLEYVNSHIKDNVSKLEITLNDDYLDDLNKIDGLSLPDYKNEVLKKQNSKGLKGRDEI